jgi:glucokinase
MILAGDVGGTKTHLALCRTDGDRLVRERHAITATAGHASLEDAVRSFLAESAPKLEGCAFGVAGPVVDGRVDGANLPWPVAIEKLRRATGGTPVRLLNDLEASALALDNLTAADLVTLQDGSASFSRGTRALVSPGTGLGLAIVPAVGPPLASEAGHSDFAPRTDDEIDLLRYLRDQFERVSAERVVSGPGIVNVYCWLRDRGRVSDDAAISARPGDSAPAATIAERAEESAICAETLRVWCRAFGAEAGNLTLCAMARSGVFLGGGIPAKLARVLQRSEFVEAFIAKAPHVELLRTVPVAVVLDQELALKGAARAAVA